MITEIEKLLETKTAGKKSHVFYTQWQVAKDYIPQVLSAISQVFPHYSLHDRTHSETIIYNIGRIVGLKNLEKMSAIDLWMILSAAFYHDIGMFVYSEEKVNIFQNKDFVELIKKCQLETSSHLHEYALCFDIKEDKIHYKDDILDAKNYDAAMFLLAEYVRGKHSERTQESICSNMPAKLPGNPIPQRIIEVLGSICYVHTHSFDKVMELPFCEAGIDHEDCHPRYIACLLRLGDLLDIDNNRFSEVLLQTLPSIPIDTIWHNKKHISVKHLQINETKIEAIAECEDYDIADITNRWFSMIDTEMYNQMKNWNNIVPDTSYGFLPTLGEMEVILKDYDTINGKDRPSFKIDSSKAIELLQGAGLYKEPHQFIRELLQNSVDATILRVFVESEQNGESFDNNEDFYKKCKNYPIKVSIKRGKFEKDKIEWTIKISDNGIGMSKTDLSYLTTTGSSNKNIEKKTIIERMPEWMRPSGTFGIGFQSVFLFTDKVKIKTRKLNKESVLNVTLFNPAGEKDGAVLLQTSEEGQKPFGTDIELDIVRKSIPNIWTIPMEYSMASQVISSYDFVNDDSMDVDIAKIIDEIYQFSYASYIPIHLKIDEQDDRLLNVEDKKFDYFIKEYGIELSITNDLNDSHIFFRNQIVRNAIFSENFFSFQINILSGDAKKILTLNRDNIQTEYYPILRNKVIDATFEVLSKHYNKLDGEVKKYASLFINYYLKNDIDKMKKMFPEDALDEWETLRIGEANQYTLKEVIDSDRIVINDSFHFLTRQFVKKDNEFKITANNHSDGLIDFITSKIENHKLRYFTENEANGKIVKFFELSKGKPEVIIDDWTSWFKSYLYQNHYYSRNLMPCDDKYKCLRVKETNFLGGFCDHTFEKIKKKYPQMICPYIRITDGGFFTESRMLKELVNDKLYNMVYDNRFDEAVTMEQIKETYRQFIDDTKQYVQCFLEK